MPRRPKKTLDDFARERAGEDETLPTEVRALRALVLKYKKQALKQRAIVNEVVRDVALEAVEPLRLSSRIVVPRRAKKGKSEPESQHALLSDLQCGKLTLTYSMDKLAERLELYFDKVLYLAEIARTHHPVDELVIHLNGDLVEGEQIFPHQPMEIEAGVLSQALFGADITAREITRIAPHYPSTRVIITPGNHGRAGKEFDPETNWDLVWGHFVKHMLQHIPNVHVEVCHNWYTVVRVKGWGYLQAHGDGINTWMNVPWYGITQRIMRWLDSVDEPWDYVLLGHFHNFANFVWNYTEVLMNGTPESGNDFALKKMGMSGRPMQVTWFTHPGVGMTSRYPVWLDKRPPRSKG
jgi:hypothetical protein